MAHTKSSIDSNTLALLGKKEVLKRRFGFWSLFGFAICELVTWETVLAIFNVGFDNGGPAGLVYGFIIAWSSSLSVYTVISELASMAPIAAGQYYWVHMLAPERYKVFCSYIIGWLTMLAWIATVATQSIFAGTICQGLIVLSHEDEYEPELWQGTLFAWLVIVVAILINVLTPGALPKFEIFIIVFHIAGFITIMSILWMYSPHRSAQFVFTTSLNEGGWPTQGLSYCVGFMGNVATFVGADASVHLAEEVINASWNIPRAIIGAMFINGAVGFSMMLTLLFCIGDVSNVLDTATGYPFIQIFYDCVKSIPGAVMMGVIVLVLTWACAIGICTTASRMTWSFARDNGTPFSKTIGYVSKSRRIPTMAILVVTGISALLVMIYIGSSTAFNDVISLTITGFYGSYFLPAAFLLYHRVKGHIRLHKQGILGLPIALDGHDATKVNDRSEDRQCAFGQNDCRVSAAEATLIWGPFHLPGWLGIINNAYACVYMLFVIFWSCWPSEIPINYNRMNYSVVVTGGVIIFSIIWYYIQAHKEYKGPTVDGEIGALMVNRESV
ncbi:amino acid transporter [Colletotrichum zoysiae]|uniref:Amino acid transporter n=1 Tax=Colletotrichum zoysiae TaxID=1216348 RepID=A0AAD9H2T3_9PEZI|nr:amino acid transporter [Colletotrichum zoysiae]